MAGAAAFWSPMPTLRLGGAVEEGERAAKLLVEARGGSGGDEVGGDGSGGGGRDLRSAIAARLLE